MPNQDTGSHIRTKSCLGGEPGRGDAPGHLSLCHCTPDKSGDGDNGGYYEQPPNQPEDADKYERSDDDSKENSY